MANMVRVRVELKRKFNDSEKNFKEMFHEFKRRVNLNGVMADFKDHQHYITNSERGRKRRRNAKKQSEMQNIEKKVLAGEKVNMSSCVVKKVLFKIRKDKEKNRSNDKI